MFRSKLKSFTGMELHFMSVGGFARVTHISERSTTKPIETTDKINRTTFIFRS